MKWTLCSSADNNHLVLFAQISNIFFCHLEKIKPILLYDDLRSFTTRRRFDNVLLLKRDGPFSSTKAWRSTSFFFFFLIPPILFACAQARPWRCWAHVPHWYFSFWVILSCSRFLSLKWWLLVTVCNPPTAHSFIDSHMLELEHCLFSLVGIDWILKASVLKAQLYPLIWPETARIECVSERASWILISIQLYSFYASCFYHNPYTWQLFKTSLDLIPWMYIQRAGVLLFCGWRVFILFYWWYPLFIYWRRYSRDWILLDTGSPSIPWVGRV